VDQVSVGQQVSVRFSGINQRTTPELPGTVDYVSADLTLDENRKISFYEVRIRLDADAPRQIGGAKLVPGMPADAFIQMQSRTVLSYLLQPLTDQFSRAFREE
jgi:HlyD family secretion protein